MMVLSLIWKVIMWFLEPLPFLVIRVIADFAGGGYLFYQQHWLTGGWLTLVGFVTLVSAFRAKNLGKAPIT